MKYLLLYSFYEQNGVMINNILEVRPRTRRIMFDDLDTLDSYIKTRIPTNYLIRLEIERVEYEQCPKQVI